MLVKKYLIPTLSSGVRFHVTKDEHFCHWYHSKKKNILPLIIESMGNIYVPVSYVHLLRVGWRNFFPVVVLCQFLVLVGNRFWFYILMYLEYNTVVVLC
jgi:hypothetical protein